MDVVDPVATSEIKLDACGVEKASPSDDDIAHALEGPRDDDWYVTLWRGDDDYMEVMLSDGALWVECEEGERYVRAESFVDDAAVKSMLLAFRDGSSAWRDLASWKEPPPKPAKKPLPPPVMLGASAFVGVMTLGSIATAIGTHNGGWLMLMFALLFPGIIALAAATKVAAAQRAAKWTRASARILRSELVTEKRNDREQQVPRVEYEFNVGFHPYRGSRVDFAEIVAGPDAVATVSRYRVGTTVPVYYNPADPAESVLDRELPSFFRGIWIAIGVITAGILAVGIYILAF